MQKFRIDGVTPLPIDELVEFEMQVDLAPIPRLEWLTGEAIFWGTEANKIYVDQDLFENRPYQFRLDLATEVCHLILHRPLIEHLLDHHCSPWKHKAAEMFGFLKLEEQASLAARSLLMPEKDLARHFAKLDGLHDPTEVYEYLVHLYRVPKNALMGRLKDLMDHGKLVRL